MLLTYGGEGSLLSHKQEINNEKDHKRNQIRLTKADLSDIKIPSQIQNETRDFIGKLLKKNGDERMNANEALKHPLILKYLD